MHGYGPGTITPTTDLILTHKHPDDRAHVAHTLDAISAFLVEACRLGR